MRKLVVVDARIALLVGIAVTLLATGADPCDVAGELGSRTGLPADACRAAVEDAASLARMASDVVSSLGGEALRRRKAGEA